MKRSAAQKNNALDVETKKAQQPREYRYLDMFGKNHERPMPKQIETQKQRSGEPVVGTNSVNKKEEDVQEKGL